MVGTLVGFKNGVSKTGKDFCIVYYMRESEKDTALVGSIAEQCFASAEVSKKLTGEEVLGSEISLRGSYDKNGHWNMYCDGITLE